MKIRKGNEKDKEGVAIVLKNSYNIKSIIEGKWVFLNEIKKSINYIVAEDNGKIVGLTSWYMHGLPKHGLCELDRIAVLPEYKGKGVADQLFNGLIDDAQKTYKKYRAKMRKLFLLTHASNKRAHHFYEKVGLKLETKLKRHYYKDEDEIVYSRFF